MRGQGGGRRRRRKDKSVNENGNPPLESGGAIYWTHVFAAESN
jgi:hypothetical protein